MYAITAQDAPKAIGCASQGATVARFVFVSAQLPLGPGETMPCSDDVAEQTSLCIRNIERVLAQLDLTLADVSKTTVYLHDLGDLAAMDEAYARAFALPAPARSILGGCELPYGAKVQVEAIACR